jgi:hypothetical protein
MKGVTSVTVSVPLTIRRRGGRKQIIRPDGAVARAGDNGTGFVPVHGDPALIKALARGFRWRRMLEDGRYASIRELAIAEKVDRAYVGRLLNMTLLAPDLVEAILGGADFSGRLPLSHGPAVLWAPQRAGLGASGGAGAQPEAPCVTWAQTALPHLPLSIEARRPPRPAAPSQPEPACAP